VGPLFILSGVAALIYQVAWQRLLALVTGIGIYSVAMIVAAFMAGLGVGSHWGGHISRRVEPRCALRLFASVELALAAFALCSPTLYYEVLRQRLGWLYAQPYLFAVVQLIALLVPTTLMGMSLPLLVRAVVREAEGAERTIGLLYGLNVAGASLGAMLTPWLLIRFCGIPGAILTGAGCNALVGIGGLLLLRSASSFPAAPPGPAPDAGRARPPALWMVLYAGSGFCALGLEVLWFRVTDVAVKATAFSFGSVLAVYLAGLAAGSLFGAPLVRQVRDPLAAFLACQCALLLYSSGAILLLTHAPSWGLLAWLDAYWAQPYGFKLGSLWEWAAVLRLYVVVPLVLYGPATVAMGLSFPLLQRAVQDDPRASGYKVGLLQAANIGGCVVGSLVVGLLSLAWIGTAGTLRALLLVGALFGLFGIARLGWRSPFPALVAALVLAAWTVPNPDRLWGRLHGVAQGSGYFGEDAAGLVAITPDGEESWRVSVNGRSISSLPFGGTHSELGAIPVVIHPEPREVAVIGLGSGDTAWAAACRSATQRVTVFEICAPELTLLKRLARERRPARLQEFLGDRRVQLRFADGRHALETETQRYDVIEADPLLPYLAYSGNLNSLEFFSACARRLAPRGLMCTWAPTPRVHATFRRVFPHVLVVSGVILVGSHEPIAVDPGLWRARLMEPGVFRYLGPKLFRSLWAGLRSAGPAGPADPGVDSNRDLFPRDEFQSPHGPPGP
jgi:predicted membrane-bound spermidine synthase